MGPAQQLVYEAEATDNAAESKALNNVPDPSNESVRFWTLSRRRRWLSATPDHTGGQYSSIGQTKHL